MAERSSAPPRPPGTPCGTDEPRRDGTSRQLRRVAFASCAGTTIEFYDFFIYGTAAALVFPRVFFPALGDSAATVASLATLGVAFVARPIARSKAAV
jgi:hypothetical protein